MLSKIHNRTDNFFCSYWICRGLDLLRSSNQFQIFVKQTERSFIIHFYLLSTAFSIVSIFFWDLFVSCYDMLAIALIIRSLKM
jgi:hypothetical protein